MFGADSEAFTWVRAQVIYGLAVARPRVSKLILFGKQHVNGEVLSEGSIFRTARYDCANVL